MQSFTKKTSLNLIFCILIKTLSFTRRRVMKEKMLKIEKCYKIFWKKVFFNYFPEYQWWGNQLSSDCNWTRTQNPNWPNDWAVSWVLICTMRLTVCSCHVTYAFQSNAFHVRFSSLAKKWWHHSKWRAFHIFLSCFVWSIMTS